MRYEETELGQGVIDGLNNVDDDLALVRKELSNAMVAVRSMSHGAAYAGGRGYVVGKVAEAIDQAINDVRKEVNETIRKQS